MGNYFSALVSNVFNLICFGEGEKFARFVILYENTKNNTENIVVILIVAIIYYFAIKKIFINGFKGVLDILHPHKHDKLIEIIKFEFIPDAIKSNEKIIHNEIYEKIDIKDIDRFKEIKKQYHLNKEIYKQINELKKLKDNKAISKEDFKRITKSFIDKIM